jgi:hypothetical protein
MVIRDNQLPNHYEMRVKELLSTLVCIFHTVFFLSLMTLWLELSRVTIEGGIADLQRGASRSAGFPKSKLAEESYGCAVLLRFGESIKSSAMHRP